MTVRFVSLLLEGSLVKLFEAEAESKDSEIPLLECHLSDLQTKHSGWNFLNMAVMHRPVICCRHIAQILVISN